MDIVLNGEKRELEGAPTVNDLLTSLGVRRELVVVEVNEEIVKRPEYAKKRISPGDRIEVVHMVAGGSDGKNEIASPREKGDSPQKRGQSPFSRARNDNLGGGSFYE